MGALAVPASDLQKISCIVQGYGHRPLKRTARSRKKDRSQDNTERNSSPYRHINISGQSG